MAQLRVLTLNVQNDEGDPPTNGIWPSDHFGVLVDLDIGGDS